MTPHDDHGHAHFLGLSGDNFSEVRPASANESAILWFELFSLCQSFKVLARVALQQSVKIKPSARRRIDHLGRQDMQRNKLCFLFARQSERVIKRLLGSREKSKDTR